ERTELGQAPVQAVVDEASGQGEQEVAFHGCDGTLDVEAVVEDAVEDGSADEVVVIGLGAAVGHPGAKILAAVTAGGVLCVEDVQPQGSPVVEGTDVAVQAALAVAAAAAGRAGIGLGLAADRDYLVAEVRLHAHGLRSWVTEVRYRCPRAQALSVKSSRAYGACRSEERCGVNEDCQNLGQMFGYLSELRPLWYFCREVYELFSTEQVLRLARRRRTLLLKKASYRAEPGRASTPQEVPNPCRDSRAGAGSSV